MQEFVKDFFPVLDPHLKGLDRFLLESVCFNCDYLIGNSGPRMFLLFYLLSKYYQ